MSDLQITDAVRLPRRCAAHAPVGPLLPLSVSGLRLDIPRGTLLDGVDLTLPRHGCTVIMGPNGAGKSILLKLLHGLLAPTAGSVSWNGLPATEATARQALVFQKPVLLRRSVAANLDFVLKARGGNRARRDALLADV